MQTILKEKEYYIFWTMNKWLLELKPRKNITYDRQTLEERMLKVLLKETCAGVWIQRRGQLWRAGSSLQHAKGGHGSGAISSAFLFSFLQLLFTFFYVCLMSITTFTLWLCHWSLAEALLERVTFNLHALHNLQTSKQLYWTDWVIVKGVFV